MKKITNTLLISLCLLAFASCVKDENPTKKDDNKISLNFAPVVVDPSTKATLEPNSDETAFDAEWESNIDKIGICSFLGDEVYKDNETGTWNGSAFNTSFDGDEGVEMSFIGIYPYNTDGEIDFGSSRIQNGNAYNSAYDVMKSEMVTTTLASDATITLPMHRETAIAYFHLTGTPAAGEKIQSATLTIDADEATPANIAGDIIYGDGEILTEGTSNSITITFADDTNPSADDFKLWFNVLPASYKTLKLEVATEHYTMTINNTNAGSYEAGKLYKVSAAVPVAKWERKPDSYTLVTSALSDWRGDYLIAYSDDVFMDGSLAGGKDGVGAAGSSVAPGNALSGNNVSVSWGDQHYVTIEAVDDNDLSQGYVIKSHSETTPYFYQTTNSNGMACSSNKATAAAYPITIAFNSPSDVDIALGGNAKGAVLHYNSTQSGLMFRFYKDGGQSPIYLYKRTSTVPVVTVTASTISEIKNILKDGTSSNKKEFEANLTGAVVTYVNGNNAFIEDNTGAILYFKSGHGLSVGDVITGNIKGTGYKHYGVVEIDAITTNPTIVSGDAPSPAIVTFEQLSANFDAYDLRFVKVENVTLGSTGLSTGSRNSTVFQAGNEFPIYAKVDGVTIAANAYGDMVCFPCYNNSTKQIGVWETSHFTAKQAPVVAVTGVSLDKTTATIAINGSTTLVATVAPTNATNKVVSWESSNPAVATVSASGVVTGVAAGTATITVTTVDGNFTAECTVTVSAASSSSTYTKITSLSQLTSGDYVIVGAQKVSGLGVLEYGTLSSGRIPYAQNYTSAPASIENPAEGAVWHLTVSGSTVTLYNVANETYIADAGSGKLKYASTGMSFTAACADGIFSLASGTYFLCVNTSANYWRNYASGTGYNKGVCLYLYKKN